MYKGAGITGIKALLNGVPIGQSGNNDVSRRLYIRTGWTMASFGPDRAKGRFYFVLHHHNHAANARPWADQSNTNNEKNWTVTTIWALNVTGDRHPPQPRGDGGSQSLEESRGGAESGAQWRARRQGRRVKEARERPNHQSDEEEDDEVKA